MRAVLGQYRRLSRLRSRRRWFILRGRKNDSEWREVTLAFVGPRTTPLLPAVVAIRIAACSYDVALTGVTRGQLFDVTDLEFRRLARNDTHLFQALHAFQ
jgi:hypothetical protein